jgi:hypothetical protein
MELENRELRTGVMDNWRKFHIEELQNFCAPQNIIRKTKSSRIGWAGHVTCMI